ncbi:low-specificity L-threonine aldolase [Caldisalinibacter kiritimatiensis]|uniref:Low-specificity L-threonine aldolase n=1 Tax=Caldisalinibacter kiritimatiensis TaxID=1304284 RepID=R1AXL2_9FIRM|nr:low-specificity L-threonine aldolase [Caldisalinibacter kiritimatiensis]EOD01392.1 Low-specificity L-threonine aldolase [Caldisalinibacter kiritimatiensis]
MMRIVDFRSDTITKPTEEMRKAMYEAEVGDDVYKEDPTIKKLERVAADIVGKEAALFVPSGTMGNQLAVLTHTERGQEVILEDWSHICRFEVGGIAFLSGVQAKTVKGTRGVMSLKDVNEAIVLDNDIHHPQTGLICLENTHNMAGGVVVPIDVMNNIYNLAKENKLPVHLDGARVFNAAVYLGCEVKEITKYTDSVMFCLSKGLSAPVGSILAGSEAFVEKARRYRKMFGGGMRQAGVIAAAGLVALDKMIDRLKEDHDNIKLLASKLNQIDGIEIDNESVQTNILMINIESSKYSSKELVEEMKKRGILTSVITDSIIRFVTHRHITKDNINYAVDKINEIMN